MKCRMLLHLLLCVILLTSAATVRAQYPYDYEDPFDAGWPGTDWDHTLNSGTWGVVDDGGDYYVTGTGPHCSAHCAYSHAIDPFHIMFGENDSEQAEWGYDFRIPSASEDISFAVILGTPGDWTLGVYVIMKTCNPSSFTKVASSGGYEENLAAPPLARDVWYTLKILYAYENEEMSLRIQIAERDGGLPFYDVSPTGLDLVGFGPLDAITIAAESTSVHHFDNVFLRSTIPPVPTENATWGEVKSLYSR